MAEWHQVALVLSPILCKRSHFLRIVMSINSTEKVEPADCRVQTFDFISCYYKNARISALGANKTDVDSISNNLLPLDSRQWRLD